MVLAASALPGMAAAAPISLKEALLVSELPPSVATEGNLASWGS